jgi:hypothetical protein
MKRRIVTGVKMLLEGKKVKVMKGKKFLEEVTLEEGDDLVNVVAELEEEYNEGAVPENTEELTEGLVRGKFNDVTSAELYAEGYDDQSAVIKFAQVDLPITSAVAIALSLDAPMKYITDEVKDKLEFDFIYTSDEEGDAGLLSVCSPSTGDALYDSIEVKESQLDAVLKKFIAGDIGAFKKYGAL